MDLVSTKTTTRPFRTWYAFTACLVLMHAADVNAQGETPTPFDLAHQPLERIEPGVVVGQQQKSGYSNLVTLAVPRLASGDIESLPEYAKRYAAMFNFAVMANVTEEKQPQGKPVYRLDKVAIGFAMNIQGRHIIVTEKTANQLGAELGMIDRRVLAGNEDCLDDVVQVARNDRLVIFDAKANMVVGDDHQERVLRHFLWVSPTNGKLGFLVWQLDTSGAERSGGQYKIDSPDMQLLPEGFQEDRQIHVSKGGLLSSIPTPDRFALVQIPRGTSVPFADSMKVAAAKKFLTKVDLQHIVQGVAQSLAHMANQQSNNFR